MSPSRRPRPSAARRTASVVAAGVLPLALSACGASLDAQTYQERTQAEATNTAIGTLAVRNLAVEPPAFDRTYQAGSDAMMTVTITNSDDEDDTLLEASTPAAEEVEVLVDGEVGEAVVPGLGSTEDSVELRLVELTDDLREGEYIVMTLRFADNGTLEVPVPIATSGETDRPVYTGEEGGEGEPALQAPAGGHHGEEEADEVESVSGVQGEAERGEAVGDETTPRSDQAEEPAGEEPAGE